jgi:hypothetical protein
MTTTTATTGPDISDAHQDVIAAALGRARFLEVKGAAIVELRDLTEAFAAELTTAEKTRIREALDGAPLDHAHLEATLGADRYAEMWQTVLMPSTPDRFRDAAIRASLDRQLTTAEREALNPAEDDSWATALGMTPAELAAVPAAAAPEAPAPAKRPAPAGLRVSTRRVAGGVDGRDFAYVGLVKLGRTVVAECGHEHANRDWAATVAGGSAKSCAESILDGARRPATAEHVARKIRTAPLGLRPAAGFQHPAGTIEAARAAAEKNEAGYLAAVATVREHLDTLEEPLPGTDTPTTPPAPPAATDAEDGAEAPRCLDAGPRHACDSVPAYRHALTATNVSFPRCNAAWAAALAHHDRVRRDYPDSPTPPAWFDPTAAGESWDEPE